MTMHELKIRHLQKKETETVLIMQGGGSLGAYECGVYKCLFKHGIELDIVAGTSIGAVNAAIIAGSKNNSPDTDLENFWLEVAETVTSSIVQDSLRGIMSASYAAFYGNRKIFSPVWFTLPHQDGNKFSMHAQYAFPAHLYGLDALKRTLKKYINFSKLNSKCRPRLIVTCTDIRNSEAVVFDSVSMKGTINSDHVVSCAGYPFYGIGWTKVDGKYLWDGALQSNTPLREVIDSSPRRDKKVYIVSLFPHVQEVLPANMMDVWHRARDIMYTDKTDHNVKMSRVISKYLLLMREMHDILNNADLDEELHERFRNIEHEYHQMADLRGAIIDEIIRIERTEDTPFLFEDADFSLGTIKKLIKQGHDDTEKVLAKKQNQKKMELSNR